MLVTRRKAILTTLFGAGLVGVRSFVTGVPLALLSNPRKALADTPDGSTNTKAQYIIFATSGAGDPMGCNAPGTYITPPQNAPPIIHSYPGVNFNLGSFGSTMAAQPWADLAASTPWVSQRMQFFHMMTNTPIHPKEPDVLKLMGYSSTGDMLPSILAAQLQPALGTLQAQPISVGAPTPAEAISYQGAPQPIIPPTALRDTLAAPTKGALANVASLRKLRDSTLNQFYPLYKNNASPAQKAYIDSMSNSQAEFLKINDNLLQMLSGISDDSADSQWLAAAILFQMNVTPVVSVHIPFGADNHFDTGLATEIAELSSTPGSGGGTETLINLMKYLDTNTWNGTPAKDLVTVMTLNVFGRTLSVNQPGSTAANGRNHNFSLQTSLVIGKGFAPGVIGGIQPVPFFSDQDYGAQDIGGVKAIDTLCSFAQTMIKGVGGDPSVILQNGASGSGPTGTGQVINAALASS